MKFRFLLGIAVIACLGTSASTALADAEFVGGGGDDLWSNAANWDPGIPQSATERHNPPAPPNNDNNVARFKVDGTTTLIQDGIDAVAFGVQLGHPADGAFGEQASTNTLNMTGGTLTTQGNFLFNVGRGRNENVNQLAQFNVSGGVVNAAGITVPEGFNPDNVLGFNSVGINAEMHVSGDAVVNTDLLRLGAADANSVVTVSDNAVINLNDENNGFANGTLWIEAFEDPGDIGGSSLLDIRDNAYVTIWGEWFTDENGNGNRDRATATELQWFEDNVIANGWIVANGGNTELFRSFRDPDGNGQGVIVLSAIPNPVIPEPSTLGLATIGCLLAVWRTRRK